MVEYKPGVDNTTAGPNVYDSVKENLLRTVDEMAKAQPQYYQSISNLQLDYIQTAKNIIQTTVSAQKQLLGNNWTISSSGPYTEQLVHQSNQITNSTIRAVDVNNQFLINSFDTIRENLKVCNRTIDTFTEFNNNAMRAWNSIFSTTQQQQRQFLSKI
ncbi:MAG TPA: hypothetical protein VH796_13810 [Nitrososphaeraceae archaeon]